MNSAIVCLLTVKIIVSPAGVSVLAKVLSRRINEFNLTYVHLRG